MNHSPTLLDTRHLTHFILKLLAYALYALFVLVDGLVYPESYQTKMLTLPYLIGGLALARAFGESLDCQHHLHAGIFATGLTTLAALA
jgi:hypothetical protein